MRQQVFQPLPDDSRTGIMESHLEKLSTGINSLDTLLRGMDHLGGAGETDGQKEDLDGAV